LPKVRLQLIQLLESEISPSGVVILKYARAGDVKKGSFALEVPTEAELARRKRLREGKMNNDSPSPYLLSTAGRQVIFRFGL